MRPAFRLATAVVLAAAAAVAATARQPGEVLAGRAFAYAVQRGDTWQRLSARFGIAPEALAGQNGRSPRDRLRAGESIQVDARHLVPPDRPDGITINIPQRMLFVLGDGGVIGSYPVGLGLPSWPTFTGPFTVVVKEVDPAWDVPLSIQEEMRQQGKPVITRVAPGPSNPLGPFWLGLSVPNYGIHGTTAPHSIYRFQSHGCIRLHNDDITALFAQVEAGAVGEIIYQPLLLRTLDDRILLEAHHDVYGRQPDPDGWLSSRARDLGIADRMDWTLVARVLALRDGQPHPVQRRLTRQHYLETR